MPEYKLYCLDGRGRITRRHDFVATDDRTAAEQGNVLGNGSDCELWSGTRKVAMLPAGSEPVWMDRTA